MDDTTGLNLGALEGWISSRVPDLSGPFEWQRLEGGHSNLTYGIRSANGTRAVLRRPPLGELHPRAHDMGREFRVLSALWCTAVPVAEPLAECDDIDVIGAPFYVMGYVAGRPLSTAADVRDWLPDDGTQRVAAESYVDVLADMHILEPDAIGLGGFAKRSEFVDRQLASWYRSWTTSAGDAGCDDPRVHRVHDLLKNHKPAELPVRLVHGDYGLHNCLVDERGAIAAVLDWEVCTLGDPRFDVAYVINRWSVEGAVVPGREAQTMPATFPSIAEVVARYRSRTGNDLVDLDYFIALNHWRSACIVHGVYTRYVRGQKPVDGVDLEAFKSSISARLEAASEAVAGWG